MTCSIRFLIIIVIFISNSISFETLFEDDFEVFDETKWEIISPETSGGEFNYMMRIILPKLFLFT